MTSPPFATTVSRADLEHNPHPHLHRLRAVSPVAWLPILNGWLVTRYDLAVAVMRDDSTFTVDHPGFSTAQVVGQSMLSRDGAEHLRHRRPFDAPFHRQAVDRRFAHSTEEHAQQLLARLQADGKADLCRDYAAPLAVWTMIDALGLTATPIHSVLGWYAAIVDAVTRITLGEAISPEGKQAFAALKAALLPALRAAPEASLLAAAGAANQGLSADEIIANAAVLLFGGIETTEGMIANALSYLLTDPQLLTNVRAEPARIPAVIEETLRLEPAAAVVDRYATSDTQLGGATIHAGDLVRVSLSAANRDPAVFPQPDHFDPARDNLRSHVAFAQGPHVCLGLHLARLEATTAVVVCLQQLPDLQLASGAEVRQAAQPRGLLFRKPQALTVTWRT
ncbi:MAG TPA: cytochrome P450 [Caldilineaceae bacterium]|nr:cytochrome P450 [Caldilineaceae bacterium]